MTQPSSSSSSSRRRHAASSSPVAAALLFSRSSSSSAAAASSYNYYYSRMGGAASARSSSAAASSSSTSTSASYLNWPVDSTNYTTAAAADVGGHLLPSSSRLYGCSFCGRRFRCAQALGGHMNVHRRDRARLAHLPLPFTTTTFSSAAAAASQPPPLPCSSSSCIDIDPPPPPILELSSSPPSSTFPSRHRDGAIAHLFSRTALLEPPPPPPPSSVLPPHPHHAVVDWRSAVSRKSSLSEDLDIDVASSTVAFEVDLELRLGCLGGGESHSTTAAAGRRRF